MSEKHQGFMKALKCRECGREYPLEATHVCEFDFGPLEVAYDYDRIKKSVSREIIASRPKTMWRYRELLPIAGEPTVGAQVGFTPLIKADRLAKKLGIRELWIKNDEVNRLCAEIAGKFGWAFVNVNMRPYYAEGSKSMAYEIAEQLGWRAPQHTIVPMASGSLLTKIHKGYQELAKVGLITD